MTSLYLAIEEPISSIILLTSFITFSFLSILTPSFLSSLHSSLPVEHTVGT